MSKELLAASALLTTLNKQAADQKDVVDGLKAKIIAKMRSEDMTSVKVDNVRLTVAKHFVPDVDDWDKVYEYIYDHKAFDMLHKRITIGALQDRIDSGEIIKGVKLINQPILKVTK